MPRYDYMCKNRHIHEVYHGMLEEPEVVCGVCGEQATKVVTEAPMMMAKWNMTFEGPKGKSLAAVKNLRLEEEVGIEGRIH